MTEDVELPHEFLAKVARGEAIEIVHTTIHRYKRGARIGQVREVEYETVWHYPSFQERMDAAKAVAQYYAPKLSAQTVKSNNGLLDLFAKAVENVDTGKPTESN